MKLIYLTIAAATLIGLADVELHALQPRPAPSVASPSQGAGATAVPDGKVAIVDTEAFGDPKTGIVRLVNAFEVVNREFSPQREELRKLRAQFDQIAKEIEATKNVADVKTLAAKADRAELLKKEIERKAQDAQDAYSKRLRQVSEPVWKDINVALEAYARQRGVNVVFDVSKLGQVMLVINAGVDLTRGFVADYNQRNPAAAPSARP